MNFLCDSLYHTKAVNIRYGLPLPTCFASRYWLLIYKCAFITEVSSSVAMLLIVRGATSLTSKPLGMINNAAAKATAIVYQFYSERYRETA